MLGHVALLLVSLLCPAVCLEERDSDATCLMQVIPDGATEPGGRSVYPPKIFQQDARGNNWVVPVVEEVVPPPPEVPGGPPPLRPACMRRYKSVLIWLQLHNVAGMWPCTEAKAHGEKSTWLTNCHQGMDSCGGKSPKVHCNERVRQGPGFRDWGFKTFSIVERPVQDADLSCGRDGVAVYGTMLRDPLSQVQAFLRSSPKDTWDLIRAILNHEVPPANGRLGEGAFSAASCLPQNDHYQHMDNYATRTLSGNYNTPPGSVSREDLELAKQRLESMDVVLILEQLKDHLPQLNASFCWDVKDLDRIPTGLEKVDEFLSFLNEEERLLIRSMNSLDYELYSFAQDLARRRTSAAGAFFELQR